MHTSIGKTTLYVILVNVVIALFMLMWVTNDDLTNLPHPTGERFISILYYSLTTFTTTGYGDISAKSTRMKFFMTMYMIAAYCFMLTLFVK